MHYYDRVSFLYMCVHVKLVTHRYIHANEELLLANKLGKYIFDSYSRCELLGKLRAVVKLCTCCWESPNETGSSMEGVGMHGPLLFRVCYTCILTCWWGNLWSYWCRSGASFLDVVTHVPRDLIWCTRLDLYILNTSLKCLISLDMNMYGGYILS